MLRGERAYYLVSPVQPAPPPVLTAFGQWLGEQARAVAGAGTGAAGVRDSAGSGAGTAAGD